MSIIYVLLKSERQRKEDYIFEPVEEVIKGFEKSKGVSIKGINVSSRGGKNCEMNYFY